MRQKFRLKPNRLLLGLAACVAVAGAAAEPVVSWHAKRLPPAGAAPAGGGNYTPAGSQMPTDAGACEAWESGRRALQAGQLDAADEAFRRASTLEPRAYAPALRLADVALYRGRLGEADKLMARARELAPKSAEVAAASGGMAVASQRLPDAQADSGARLPSTRASSPRTSTWQSCS